MDVFRGINIAWFWSKNTYWSLQYLSLNTCWEYIFQIPSCSDTYFWSSFVITCSGQQWWIPLLYSLRCWTPDWCSQYSSLQQEQTKSYQFALANLWQQGALLRSTAPEQGSQSAAGQDGLEKSLLPTVQSHCCKTMRCLFHPPFLGERLFKESFYLLVCNTAVSCFHWMLWLILLPLSILLLLYVQLQFLTLFNKLRKFLGQEVTGYLIHIIDLWEQGSVCLLKQNNIPVKF